MECSEFLSGFSDFRDGLLSSEASYGFESHLEACPSCRRYDEVLTAGVDTLRALPIAPRKDLHARLQHSIYNIEEERRRRRAPKGGVGMMSLVAMAAIVSAVVCTPFFWESDPSVELPAIVAQAPTPAPPTRVSASAPTAIPFPNAGSFVALPLPGQGLWTESNALLYQHSSLYLRHKEPSLILAGLR
jgi:predicted anti-sigma-YlaC factor YlaD